ncbi:hypothetical protein [Nostoc sp.]|uniref:hypothetical protein n=1 Tax=Nostoc sp. TaxID=1180 RepID=UPI002FFA17C8
MESTMFTALTPNEEVNLSGGNKVTPIYNISFILKALSIAKASNTVSQTATGGAGGAGGPITIGGGKDSPVVIINSKISSSGGAGGGANNTSNNAVGAST